MSDRQSQKADIGIQAGRDVNISSGIDARTALEIFDAKAVQLRQEFTAEANALVDGRLAELERRLIPVFESEQLLPAFGDPDFQFNLLEAQRAASRTGDSSDFELLVDLLAQRAAAAPEPRVKLATRRAIDIVGLVDPLALNGLSAAWFYLKLIYNTADGSLEGECAALERDLRGLMDGGLPPSPSWVGDMDVLGCVQMSPGSQQ